MKANQRLLSLVFLWLVFSTQAQVGIGNTNPQASLDISASSSTTPANGDGILIPRMSMFPTNPGAARDGMLIFYTGTASFGKGFYYWNSPTSTWIPIKGVERINDLSDGKSDNDGTDDGSSVFLGINAGAADDSSDNKNVGVGWNALQNSSTGIENIAIGNRALQTNTTGGGNIAIGHQSLLNNTIALSNVAVGGYSMRDNVSGEQNTAVGSGAMINNETGNANVAMGYQAIYEIISNNSNTGVGYQALRTTQGNANSAFGRQAGEYVDGNENVFIGQFAGSSTTTTSKSGSVMIGYQAGFGVTGNNKLFIENSSANANNALIYGEFDTNILRTNSEFQIGNPAGTGYAFPTTDGNPNYILQTDGNGQLTFINPTTIGDGTGTDDQNLLTPTLTGTTLNLGIENGTGTSVNLSGLQDDDWYEIGTTNAPNNINDQMFHNGNVAIGTNSTSNYAGNNFKLLIEDDASNFGGLHVASSRGFAISSRITGTFNGGGVSTGLNLRTEATGTRNKINIYQTLIGSGAGMTAQRNWFPSTSNYSTEIGVKNDLNGQSNGEKYATYNNITGTGTGNKYGSYNLIPATTGGTHYGVYSDVTKTNSYAGYFLGRLSIGTTTTNNYILPDSRGTANQIMQTNGAGVVSWVNAPTGENTTANNGISQTGTLVQLGGPLVQNSAITQGIYSMDINLNSTGDFAIQDNGNDVFVVEDTGDIGIGISNPLYPVHIEETVNGTTRALYVNKTDNTAAETSGIYIDKVSTGNGRNHGIFTDVSGTGTGQKYGIFNRLTSTSAGSQYGTRNFISGASSGFQFGTFNNLDNNGTSNHYGVYNGMRGANAQNLFGVYNEFERAYSGTTLITGVRNRFTNGTPGTDGMSGIYTDFTTNANGNYYGIRNEFTNTTTGNGIKYGTYNYIDTAAGGTHYGTYNDVSNANGWAGYFVGKAYVSNKLGIGTGATNPSGFLEVRANNTGTQPNINLIDIGATGARINFTNTSTTNGNVWTLYGATNNTDANSVFNIFHPNAGNIIEIFGDRQVEINGQLSVNLNNPTYAIHLPNNAVAALGQGQANAWTTYSDNRVKSSQTIIRYGLSDLLKITPKSYFHHNSLFEEGTLKLKDEGENTIGFIAQELYKVIPEAVQKPEDDQSELWSINYDKVVPVVVKAIQDLNTKVEKLEAENALLKTTLDHYKSLEARLTALETTSKLTKEEMNH